MTGHLLRSLALSPFFWKGVAVIVCAFILFVGSIYVLLSAVFGLRMGYLVLAVGFFGWMIIMSALWAFGAPGTPRNLGPRGYEPHWQVVAAGTGTAVRSKFPISTRYPGSPWHDPDAKALPSVDSVKAVMQNYLQGLAVKELERQGQKVCTPESPPGSDCFTLDPTTFVITDMKFATSDGTSLVGAQGHYAPGGLQVTMFAYRDKGNVPKYSIAFLVASILGFALHLPFLDRAERTRKQVLTGGTAPAWFGPA
jgi:hypothetical protein